MMNYNSSKKILPFSYLVLYAKGWIRCSWIKNRDTEEGYIEEVKTILRMCGYMPINQNNVLNLVLIAVDTLREEFINEKQQFCYELMKIHDFINGVKNYQSICQIKSFDIAMIKFILSCFSMLDIRHFAVMSVDYCTYKLKIAHAITSTTYTTCQKKFNESFKDMLIPKSYENHWWINYIRG